MCELMAAFSRSQRPARSVPPKVQREIERARPKRYLVLGSEGHGRGVRAHRWDKLPTDINVADYDVVVMNFAAFEDKQLAEGFPRDRLPSVESVTRLLFSPNAETIAIGNPSTRIGAPPDRESGFYDSRVRSDYWLPFFIGVEVDAGTQYRVDSEEWTAYFDHLSGWSWIATGETPARLDAEEYLRPVTKRAHHLLTAYEPVATTRYEKLIALRVRLRAVRYTRHFENWGGVSEPDRSSAEVVLEASPIFWLPTPNQVGAEEAIDTILRERYGIAQERRQPDWVAAYSLPNEAPIASEIAELEQQRRDLEGRIGEARDRRCAASATAV